MSQNRRWINTRVEYQWNGTEYVEVSVEGYWYDGPMALAHNSPSIDQDSYAFYNDGTESGSTIIGSANTAQTLDSDTTYLVRFLIQEQGGASSNNFASQLEYNVNGAGWNNVTSTSNNVRAVVSASLGTDGSNTTQRLGAGTFITTNAGVDNGDGLAGNTSFAGNDEFEAVYSIQFRNADLTDQDTVQLRIAGCNVYTRTASATINVTLAAITGTMTAQEAGTDAFAGTGDVDVSGSLTAQESGSDAFAASGSVPASGSLSVQETGSDTFAASGTVTEPGITGTMAVQETGTDTFAASGTVAWPPVTGTLNAQESGVDTLSASGSVPVSGVLATQESGADTLSASGTVSAPSIIGTMTAQESGTDILSASGNVALTGSLSSRESGADTLSASGGVAVAGTLAAQETGADTFSATGALINGIAGTMAAQESGTDTITAGGEVIIGGTLSAQEAGADIVSIAGLVRNYRGQQGTDSNHVKGSSGMTAHGASGAMTIRMGVTNNTVAMPASRPIKVQND